MIVSDFPENECGWISEIEEEKLIRLINYIPQYNIIQKTENAMRARDKYNLEQEEELIVSTYDALFR